MPYEVTGPISLPMGSPSPRQCALRESTSAQGNQLQAPLCSVLAITTTAGSLTFDGVPGLLFRSVLI
eukprot:749280-Hanusia_phi.AAC.1